MRDPKTTQLESHHIISGDNIERTYKHLNGVNRKRCRSTTRWDLHITADQIRMLGGKVVVQTIARSEEGDDIIISVSVSDSAKRTASGAIIVLI